MGSFFFFRRKMLQQREPLHLSKVTKDICTEVTKVFYFKEIKECLNCGLHKTIKQLNSLTFINEWNVLFFLFLKYHVTLKTRLLAAENSAWLHSNR